MNLLKRKPKRKATVREGFSYQSDAIQKITYGDNEKTWISRGTYIIEKTLGR